MKMRWTSVCLLLVLGYTVLAENQDGSTPKIQELKLPSFLRLRHAVVRLTESDLAQDPEGKKLILQLRGHIETFEDLLRKTEQSLRKEKEDTVESTKVRLQKVATMKRSAEVIHHLTAVVTQIARSKANSHEKILQLKEVIDDLDIKLKYFQSRMGIVASLRALVTVTVVTIRDGKKTPGYIVYCNPYRWANSKKPMITFPKLSPAETTMLPGNYKFFAKEEADKKPVASRTVKIGFDGKDKVTIEIKIPKEVIR